MKSTNRLSLLAVAIVMLFLVYLVYMAVDFRSAEEVNLMTTDPMVVQSYTITRGDKPPVLVEVWEMEYQGETIRQLRFDDTGIRSELTTMRFLLKELVDEQR